MATAFTDDPTDDAQADYEHNIEVMKGWDQEYLVSFAALLMAFANEVNALTEDYEGEELFGEYHREVARLIAEGPDVQAVEN